MFKVTEDIGVVEIYNGIELVLFVLHLTCPRAKYNYANFNIHGYCRKCKDESFVDTVKWIQASWDM